MRDREINLKLTISFLLPAGLERVAREINRPPRHASGTPLWKLSTDTYPNRRRKEVTDLFREGQRAYKSTLK